MLSDRQNSSYAKSTVNSIYIILINIERVSKHSVTIRGLRVVTTCWSWAWSNRTSPSKWVGLGSPLAACSVYGDLTCSVHTVNNICLFNCQCHFYLCNWGPYVRLAFVPNMLSSWNKDIIIIIITVWNSRKQLWPFWAKPFTTKDTTETNQWWISLQFHITVKSVFSIIKKGNAIPISKKLMPHMKILPTVYI